MKEANEMIDSMKDDAMIVVSLQRLLGKNTIRNTYYVGAVLYAVGVVMLVILAIRADAPWLVALTVVFGLAGFGVLRLFCEFWMLLYSMYERLTSIDKTLKAK